MTNTEWLDELRRRVRDATEFARGHDPIEGRKTLRANEIVLEAQREAAIRLLVKVEQILE